MLDKSTTRGWQRPPRRCTGPPGSAGIAGADHLLVTNTFRLGLMKAIRPLLTNATVAWFGSPTAPRRGPGRLAAAAFWRCTVVVPYVATLFCRQQRLTHPTHACPVATLNERASVFFQGSLSDVTFRNAAERGAGRERCDGPLDDRRTRLEENSIPGHLSTMASLARGRGVAAARR